MYRRLLLRCPASAALACALLAAPSLCGAERLPNIVILLADQWRADATGYAGDPNVKTPHLDRLAARAVNFQLAVSTYPVCSPYRASLLTGRRPLSHGVFMNDVPLPDREVTIAEILAPKGYETGYIGKWHLDGRGRSSYTPPERRQGFQYWKALECTHRYNRSLYYADSPERRIWEGYDAIAQTKDAIAYMESRKDKRFLLILSWGPPHAPYHTAPERYRRLYDPAKLVLRPNVPKRLEARVRRDLAGYYAHISALDDCVGRILEALGKLGIEDDTILVFTSDHGDLLGSHGDYKKQQPYDESIRVPFLLSYPARLGRKGRKVEAPFATEDILPTLLGLAGLEIPPSVEGRDFSAHLLAGAPPPRDAVLILCPQPFGQWSRRRGGREYRGLRTRRYTYVRDLKGPWLLFDNEQDPYQLENLAGRPEARELQARLDRMLDRMLEESGDEFLPGPVYLKRWGYKVDETGTVPYTD